jgi:hypothetical protein
MIQHRTTRRTGVALTARPYAESSEFAAAAETEGGSSMSAVAERPITIIGVPRQAATGKDACALALSYLRWASACWRGETLAPVFATRLETYWRSSLPPVPADRPDAVSPHGGGGRGIRWYHTDDAVLGYVPGAGGGYQVPVAAIPQLVRCTHTRPSMTQGSPAYESRMPQPQGHEYSVQ